MSEENYAPIENNLICNTALSANARIILFYLLSKPDNWNVSLKDVQKNCLNIYYRGVQLAFKELIEAGHANLEKVFDEQHKLVGSRYDIYAYPDDNPKFKHFSDSAVYEQSSYEQSKTELYIKKEITNKEFKKKENLILVNSNGQDLEKEQVEVQERISFSLNEYDLIKTKLGITPIEESSFKKYTIYLIDILKMPLDKLNGLKFYKEGFEKHKLNTRTKIQDKVIDVKKERDFNSDFERLKSASYLNWKGSYLSDKLDSIIQEFKQKNGEQEFKQKFYELISRQYYYEQIITEDNFIDYLLNNVDYQFKPIR